MPYAKITYKVAATGVATIALDDPDTRNALSDDLLEELIDALGAARDDAGVRCLVLTSTHETVFSSGGNLSGFAADVALVHKHFATERFPAPSGCSVSWASRRSAPPTGTCSPARSGWPWPVT